MKKRIRRERESGREKEGVSEWKKKNDKYISFTQFQIC
jgi:hypothetical protein